MAKNHELLSQKAPLKMFDRVLNKPLQGTSQTGFYAWLRKVKNKELNKVQNAFQFLRLCPLFFINFLFFDQMIALQKL